MAQSAFDPAAFNAGANAIAHARETTLREEEARRQLEQQNNLQDLAAQYGQTPDNETFAQIAALNPQAAHTLAQQQQYQAGVPLNEAQAQLMQQKARQAAFETQQINDELMTPELQTAIKDQVFANHVGNAVKGMQRVPSDLPVQQQKVWNGYVKNMEDKGIKVPEDFKQWSPETGKKVQNWLAQREVQAKKDISKSPADAYWLRVAEDPNSTSYAKKVAKDMLHKASHFAPTSSGGGISINAGNPLGLKPKDVFTFERNMRKDLEQYNKEYSTQRIAYNNLKSTLLQPNPSPAADIAGVFQFMKTLDPTSVVREGEFATAQNAAGVPERVRNFYNNIAHGNRLNPQQRREFVDQAAIQYRTSRDNLLVKERQAKQVADDSGLNFGRIRLSDPKDKEYQDLLEGKAPEQSQQPAGVSKYNFKPPAGGGKTGQVTQAVAQPKTLSDFKSKYNFLK